MTTDHRQQKPPIRSGAREDGDKAGETDGDEAAVMLGRLRWSELLLEWTKGKGVGVHVGVLEKELKIERKRSWKGVKECWNGSIESEEGRRSAGTDLLKAKKEVEEGKWFESHMGLGDRYLLLTWGGRRWENETAAQAAVSLSVLSGFPMFSGTLLREKVTREERENTFAFLSIAFLSIDITAKYIRFKWVRSSYLLLTDLYLQLLLANKIIVILKLNELRPQKYASWIVIVSS